MRPMVLETDFYKDKRVFVTGHTGFKGMWLSKILESFGAEITGYAKAPLAKIGKKVFEASCVEQKMCSIIGDVRDFNALWKCFDEAKPEIVIHLAAQPIVRESYRNPLETYSTNVMGTANILECVRRAGYVRSFLNVTTDKVYDNKEWPWGYRENEPLDGYDPYSNSKSCSELVTHSYKRSFFADDSCAISTARAGNVIGGGDFSADRIVPDIIRAAYAGNEIEVRNQYSIRPYQHVLESLYAYLLIVQAQHNDAALADSYNVGPGEDDCITTGHLADLFCKAWGEGLKWKDISSDGPHEATFLKLDCSKIKARLGWLPHWHISEAVEKTVEWAKAWQNKEDISSLMERQIEDFMNNGGQ